MLLDLGLGGGRHLYTSKKRQRSGPSGSTGVLKFSFRITSVLNSSGAPSPGESPSLPAFPPGLLFLLSSLPPLPLPASSEPSPSVLPTAASGPHWAAHHMLPQTPRAVWTAASRSPHTTAAATDLCPGALDRIWGLLLPQQGRESSGEPRGWSVTGAG